MSQSKRPKVYIKLICLLTAVESRLTISRLQILTSFGLEGAQSNF